jgi:lipoprotein-releasing system permease protein
MIQLKLALRYLVRKPITFFAVVSVMLGTTAFVVVIGVMDGYVTAFNERSRMILSDMVIRPEDTYIEQPDDLAAAVKTRVPDVVECSPNIMGMAIVKIRDRDGSFSLKWCWFLGVDPVRERKVTGLDALGSVPAASDDWIVPGADLLGSRSPDNISQIVLVTSGRSSTSPTIKATMRLASPVDFGLYQYDKEFAYIPRKTAARLVGVDDAWATEIRVRIRSPRDASAVRDRLQKALDDITAFRRFTVFRYQETSTMFRALRLQRNLATLILGCLFVAAGFAVVAICYMIVLQKTRDIGVLRTIGLSRGGVLASFVTYGAAAGMTGVILGIALGVFILDRIDWVRQTLTNTLGHDPFPETLYGLKEVPHEVKFWVLVLLSGVALTVSLLGSLYPALRAARVNVVESLRYE